MSRNKFKFSHSAAGACGCQASGFSGDEPKYRLDLVPDFVKEFCAEQAKEQLKKEYGVYVAPAVIVGGVLLFFAVKGMRC